MCKKKEEKLENICTIGGKDVPLHEKKQDKGNNMKKYLFLLAAIALASCTKDDSADGSLTLGATAFTWKADVTSQTVSVSSKAGWTASTNVNWCSPWKSKGESGEDISLWVSPNITDKERKGTLTVRSNGQVRNITLTQPALTTPIDEYQYRLPIVFHVLYNDAQDETQNVRKGHLATVVERVNDLYAQNKLNLKFVMADNDEDGNRLDEPGVMRHEVSFSDYDPYEFISGTNTDNRQYARLAQNQKKFLNVFVYRFKQTEEGHSVMGISCMPIVPAAYPLDSLMATDAANEYSSVASPWGCCLNSDYIYEWQEKNQVNSYYIVSTLAHELGHYLGLLHTFSDDECNNDDACDDTHISDYDSYTAYITDQLKRWTATGKTLYIEDLATRTDCKTGESFLADNVMDYAYCTNEKFSRQQFARMRHVLKYGSLVPGPKLTDYPTNSRTRQAGGALLLEPVKQKCPPVVMPVKATISRE